MEQARAFFKMALSEDIFGGTGDVGQLIKQGEIDVFGLRIGAGGRVEQIYVVDTAFHIKGLNYGGKAGTPVRVCKKLVRSAIITRTFFGEVPTRLIFASPQVQPKYAESLQLAMGHLDRFFGEVGYSCRPELLINDGFYEKVVEPIQTAAGDVADTSELFLRSLQMMNIFKKKKERKSAPTIEHRAVGSDGTLPIDLEPANVIDFKSKLLSSKKAVISVQYTNGKSEDQVWTANKMTANSDVIGNIRSRPQFRAGEWQRRGIARVKVKISG
jgi:hypothetical protein